jgi:hypothetical protein
MRRSSLTTAMTAAALVAAACGADPDRTATETAAGPAGQPRSRTAEAAPTPDVESRIARWVESCEDGDADAVVAAGKPAMDLLLSWLVGEDEERHQAALDLLPRFGAAAVPPLAALFDGHEAIRGRALEALDPLTPLCGDPMIAAAVWPALLRHLDDPRIERLTDDLASSAAPFVDELVAVFKSGDEQASGRAGLILRSMGTAAVAAARAILAVMRSDRSSRQQRAHAVGILQSIGSADPDILGTLQEMLRSPNAGDRQDGARVLVTWGDAAMAAGGDFVALLWDPDEDVRATARVLVPRNPSIVAAHAAEIAARLAGQAPERDESILQDLMSDAAARDAFARAESSLNGDARAAVHWALLTSAPAESVKAVASTRSADPRERLLAIRFLDQSDLPLSAEALSLLDDPDADVRTAALEVFVELRAAPAARLRAAARGLLTGESTYVRMNAMSALASVADGDAAALEEVLRALVGDDVGLRVAAAAGLSAASTPIVGPHDDVVAALSNAIAAAGSDQRVDEALGRTLLRFDGGTEAFLRAAEVRIRRMAESGEAAIDGLFAVLRATGPAAERLRPLLETTEWKNHYQANAARSVLATLTTDPLQFALLAAHSEESVRRLLAMGDAGRAAMPVFAQQAPVGRRAALLRWLAGVDLEGSIVAAALARPASASDPALPIGASRSDDGGALSASPGVRIVDGSEWPTKPIDACRREGAAILALLLPALRAVPLLGELSLDEDGDVRTAALESLLEVGQRDPQALTVEVLQPLVARPEVRELRSGLQIASLMGPRGRALAPALRRARASTNSQIRLDAAAALHAVTGDEEELRAELRDALARTGEYGRETNGLVVAEHLPRLTWTGPDLDLLLRAFQRTAPTSRDPFTPVIERLGPSAAAFVPGLTATLAVKDDRDRERRPPVLRALAAIGLAARPALPEIRRSVARLGDEFGICAAAIRAIEAAPR